MKFLLHLSILLLTGLLLSTCKEQIETDNTDKKFPLILRAERQGDGVKLSWDPSNVSNFDKYIVVRSFEPLPSGLRPTFQGGQFNIVHESSSQTNTSFIDNNVPIVDQIFYKIYIAFDNRFVESDNIKVEFNNFILQGNASVIRFLPDSNWVLYNDEFNTQIKLVNYETSKLISEVQPQSIIGFDNMVVEFYEKDGKTNLRWWANLGIQNYTLPNLSLGSNTSTEQFPGYAMAIGSGNHIYTTQYDYTNAFTVRNKNTLAIIKGYYRSEYYLRRLVTILDPATNLILETSQSNSTTFNVNSTSALLTNIKEKFVPVQAGLLAQIVISPDRQYFIRDALGEIYDRDLETNQKIPLTQSPFGSTFLQDASFSLDGQYVYAQVFDQSQGAISIRKFAFPSMELVGERVLSGINPKRIQAVQGGVVVVANISTNQGNAVFIKKFEL